MTEGGQNDRGRQNELPGGGRVRRGPTALAPSPLPPPSPLAGEGRGEGCQRDP